MADQFHLFRVFDFGRTPRVYILTGSLKANCRLEPTQYRATIWEKREGIKRSPSGLLQRLTCDDAARSRVPTGGPVQHRVRRETSSVAGKETIVAYGWR